METKQAGQIVPPIGLTVEKVGVQYVLYTRFLNKPMADRAAKLANAAPELLAACEAALKQLGGDAAWLAQCGQGQVAKGINDVVIPKLLAAIRKATT